MRIVHPWAAIMMNVIRMVTPPVVAELEDDMGEGVEISASDGDKIRQALHKVGYMQCESSTGVWSIPHPTHNTCGITIDYREDMGYDPGNCLIVFYD